MEDEYVHSFLEEKEPMASNAMDRGGELCAIVAKG